MLSSCATWGGMTDSGVLDQKREDFFFKIKIKWENYQKTDIFGVQNAETVSLFAVIIVRKNPDGCKIKCSCRSP